MRIEIHYGGRFGKDSPSGMMCLDPAVWLREKGSLRDFRKILKLCRESDTYHDTITLSEWTDFLEAEPSRIRQEAHETAREYNRLCEYARKLYDNPGLPVEAKQDDLKRMNEELRELKASYNCKMKQLSKALERVKALMEEVKKA